MTYADVGVFVLALTAEPRVPHATEAMRMVRALGRGDRALSTATLTWDEFTYVVRRLAGVAVSVTKGHELLAVPNVRWLGVDERVLRRASQIYAATSIRPRDSIHAACALENGESEILSEDGAFDQVPGLTRVWPPP